MVQAALHERLQVLQVEVPSEPLVVCGDSSRLLQVFVNLLDNAARYTPKGGHIAVVVTDEGREAVVRVTDDGIGMLPEQLVAVFELFTQAHNTLTESNLGLGIGLALTKELVHLHRGTIQARSPGLGKGSEFIVRLPLFRGEQGIAATQHEGSA
jgi:signal transduction histidine kinase